MKKIKYLLTVLICNLSLFDLVVCKGFPKIVWTYWSKDYSDDKLIKAF